MTDRKDENKLALDYAVALRKYCSEHVCMAGCVFAEYNSEADIGVFQNRLNLVDTLPREQFSQLLFK